MTVQQAHDGGLSEDTLGSTEWSCKQDVCQFIKQHAILVPQAEIYELAVRRPNSLEMEREKYKNLDFCVTRSSLFRRLGIARRGEVVFCS